jgi:hypothetical protein
MSLIVWHVAVDGVQTVTLTQGLFGYELAEQSEPFTVIGSTLLPVGALFTVRSVVPVAPPHVAATVVVPVASDVTRPLEPAVLLICATDGDEELQDADVVKSWIELSKNVPVAVNCFVDPTVMMGSAGVTEMDAIVADVTVRVVEPETLPAAAVIVVWPGAIEVADPLLIVATDSSDELHVTVAVMSCVVWSVYVPAAMKVSVAPVAITGFVGITASESSVAGVTVRVVEPETLPAVAMIVVWPGATEAAIPLLTVATDSLDELHVTDAVMFRVVLSE